MKNEVIEGQIAAAHGAVSDLQAYCEKLERQNAELVDLLRRAIDAGNEVSAWPELSQKSAEWAAMEWDQVVDEFGKLTHRINHAKN